MDGWTDGRTDKHTETKLTKLIFAYLSFAGAPKDDMQKSHVIMPNQFICVVLCSIPVRFLSCM
jgi:hypothetical protein